MASSDPEVRRRRSSVAERSRWGRGLVVFTVLVALAAVGSIGSIGVDATSPGADPAPSPPEGLLPPEEQLAAVRLGVTPACGLRLECVERLASVYGMDLSEDLAEYPDPGALLTALHQEAVVVAAVPAAEPAGVDRAVVELEDDLAMTATDGLVVVAHADLSAHEALEAVTVALTTDLLREWVSQARTGGDLADLTATAATVLELPTDVGVAGSGSGVAVRIAVSETELDQVVGAVYASALRGLGHEAEVVISDPAARSDPLTMLVAGEADVVIGAASGLLAVLADPDPERFEPRAPDRAIVELGDALERADVPLVVLPTTGPSVGLRYVVTEDAAERFGLRRLSDLISAAPPVTPLDPG